jgi:hypothetical protein
MNKRCSQPARVDYPAKGLDVGLSTLQRKMFRVIKHLQNPQNLTDYLE